VEVKLHASFSWKIDGDGWLVSRLCHFTPEKRDNGTQYIGGCVKCLTGLEVLEKIKILCPFWGWTHYSPVFNPADNINLKAILSDLCQDI